MHLVIEYREPLHSRPQALSMKSYLGLVWFAIAFAISSAVAHPIENVSHSLTILGLT